MQNLPFSKKTFLIVGGFILLGVPLLGFFSNNLGSSIVDRSASVSSEPMMKSMPGIANSNAGMMGRAEMAGDMVPTTMIAPGEPPLYYDEGFTPGLDRTIVKNANLGMVVDDTRAAVTKITDITEAAEGAVTNVSVYEGSIDSGQVFADMTLRVPVAVLDSTLASIKNVARKVTSENISAQDRTEQKVDIEAQLSNLRATETQLLTIMSQATTVEETLKVQTELSNVRGHIERFEASLENLLGEAAMSTVYVTLSTEEAELPLVDPDNRSLVQEMRLALRDAAQLYRNLFIGGLRMLIVFGPILVIAGIGYFIWRKMKQP